MTALQSGEVIAHRAQHSFFKFPKRAVHSLTTFGQPGHHGGFTEAHRERSGAQRSGFFEGFQESVSIGGREFGRASGADVSEKFFGERHAHRLPYGGVPLRRSVERRRPIRSSQREIPNPASAVDTRGNLLG